MSGVILVSDIHGCYYTLLRLLGQCAEIHAGDSIALLGDLIDRGPHSRQIVEFAMRHRIPTCMGNHEDMCLAYREHAARGYVGHGAARYDPDIWLHNGGLAALKSWDNRLPDSVLDWMQRLPAFLTPEVDERDGRRLLLSHTGYGLEAADGSVRGWFRALWGYRRDESGDAFPEDAYYRVYGHTQSRVPFISETEALIDTGVAYADSGLGVLTAFHWPTKTIVQHYVDETPCTPRFAISEGRLVPRP